MRPDVGVAARRLLRPDGSVVIPAALAGPVLRVLLRDVGARLQSDQAAVPLPVTSLFWALALAAERAEAEEGSANGPSPDRPVSMEISASQAAEELGCSVRHARRLARSGRLPARRVGRAWLIAEAAIVAPERKDQAA
ncbi:helix-turn-helix domain-containing protein [Streptomyces rhizosphaericola]|uniref:helix-turn-helix domain-containing protein n=1 Tax=Streptomyces rhizosphaericola TaxID=2564098 RepID=UPI0039F1291A